MVDEIIGKNKFEKTVGGCYIAAPGMPSYIPNHASDRVKADRIPMGN